MNIWQKLLIIINLLLLVCFVGIIVIFSYVPEAILKMENDMPNEEFMEEYAIIKDYVMNQIEADEFVRDNEQLEDTLRNEEQLEGYVDLRGYIVTERREINDQEKELAYFAFSEASDETIMPALDYLIDSGNSVNRKSSGTYYLSLGCEQNEGIENSVFNIYSDTYKDLKKSSSFNKITVRAFFGTDNLNNSLDGACISNASGIQVL
jgi:hypothetical protein